MKAKYLFLAGLSAMMLGACSSDNDLTPNPENKPTIEGEGKMILNLKFAGGALSRADGFGGYDEGEGVESDVNNAHVYFFKNDETKSWIGHSEAVILPQTPSTGNVENKVETTVPANVVQSLLISEGAKANIIVVLNKHSKLAEEGYANFEVFNAALTDIEDNAGFMMSSSTYDDSGIKNFVEITKANVAEIGAGTSPTPVTVYVERLCSKVTLGVATNLETTNNAKVDLQTWGLNVKNKKEFPVKVLNTDFTSLQTSVWPGADKWNAAADFRSYWAIDPNYTSLGENDFTIINFADLNTAKGAAEYCLENTFNFDQQNRNQTTTAVIYAQYTPQLDGSTTETAPSNHATWIAMNNRFYSLNTFVSNFLAKQNIYKKDGETNFVSPVGSDVDFTYTPVYDKESTALDKQEIGGKDYKLAEKTENPTTLYKFTGTDISNAKPEDFNEYADNEWTELNTAFATYCKDAKIYINGYCYYEILIRHFTDTEVPLVADKINTQSQLGRYGIVRNHSYKLTINKVLNPGKPISGETITPEDGPDDDTADHYMDVTINVLSWAVRNQGVDL